MNKKGVAKITFTLVLLTFSGLFIYNIIPVLANGNPGAIWTTRNDCGDIKQDVNHYNIGEHIFINGANFDPGDHYWEIVGRPGGASCDPHQIVANGTQTVDENRNFCFDAYTVQSDDCGEYQVKFGNKGDNYRVIEVIIPCEDHTNESDCTEDPDCDWCPLCEQEVRPTKVNQWLEAKCVPKGTDCGWYCEIGYCDATCSDNTDCECPKDGCIGPDYYDYPYYGECVDCPMSCYCENGTEQGEPCEPTIYYDDPRCGECETDDDCEDDNVCTTDKCVDNYCFYTPEPLSTPCELDSDKCTIDHCDGEGSCVWEEDVIVPPAEECKSFYCDPSSGDVKENYTDYPESTFCELDDDKCTLDHCNGQGYCVNYGNVIVPDPEECKSFYCDSSDGEIKENYTDYPLSTYCELDQDECTVDHCDGYGNCVNYYNISAPSIPNKTIGEPKSKWYPTTDIEDPDRTNFYPWIVDKCWNGLEDEIECWKVTMFTPIILSCEDSVDNESVCFKVELDASDATQKYCEDIEGQYNETSGYCCVDSEIELFYFGEETEHNLEAYCVNACGISEKDEEKFKVEGTAFEIPLYKKWNLISVPFTLFNDDPDVVFKDIADDIVSVWMYDTEDCPGDGWCVWTPYGGELEIKPGWGYWVLARNDTILLIGGSLFSPATTPPSRDLQPSWNLIGYYGTEWQDYQTELDTCGYHYEYGNYVYCVLNSLVDTQIGFPRWSSLWGYDNCGNDTTHWNNLGVCDSMFAGKGYWIEMDVADGYAPATNCIWNSEFMCA